MFFNIRALIQSRRDTITTLTLKKAQKTPKMRGPFVWFMYSVSMVAIMPRAVAALLHIGDWRQYPLSSLASKGLKAVTQENHLQSPKLRVSSEKAYMHSVHRYYCYSTCQGGGRADRPGRWGPCFDELTNQSFRNQGPHVSRSRVA